MSTDDSQKLRLVPKPAELPQPRNYWNTSGKNKEFFPTEPRPESIPTLNKQGRVIQEPSDEWWINSPAHNYCFWTYVRETSQPDGTMEPLLQSEIAKLFGCSSTKVHFMLKEAMDRLTSEENLKFLQDLMELTRDEPREEALGYSVMSEIEQTNDDEDFE